jgi:hypothetical protein
MATQTVCTCYVQHLTEEERFTLRYGAHEIECPVYRESLDPVDKLKDDDARIYFLLGCTQVTEVVSKQWLSECCDATPVFKELDLSTIPFGGPTGFCSKCHDTCIFIVGEL